MVTVSRRTEGGVLHVRLNRPEKANAYNGEMLSELRESFRQISPGEARAIILSGAGKNFCAGADLRWIHDHAAQGITAARSAAALIFAMYETLLRVELPVLGAIHGNVFGGGVGLVAACDHAVAGPGATFCLAEVRHAMIPGIIAPLVAGKIGEAHYREAAASGIPFPAVPARRWGLIQAVESAPEEQAQIWASSLAGEPLRELQERRRGLCARFMGRREELIAATSACWVSREATLGRETFLNRPR